MNDGREAQPLFTLFTENAQWMSSEGHPLASLALMHVIKLVNCCHQHMKRIVALGLLCAFCS